MNGVITYSIICFHCIIHRIRSREFFEDSGLDLAELWRKNNVAFLLLFLQFEMSYNPCSMVVITKNRK